MAQAEVVTSHSTLRRALLSDWSSCGAQPPSSGVVAGLGATFANRRTKDLRRKYAVESVATFVHRHGHRACRGEADATADAEARPERRGPEANDHVGRHDRVRSSGVIPEHWRSRLPDASLVSFRGCISAAALDYTGGRASRRRIQILRIPLQALSGLRAVAIVDAYEERARPGRRSSFWSSSLLPPGVSFFGPAFLGAVLVIGAVTGLLWSAGAILGNRILRWISVGR